MKLKPLSFFLLLAFVPSSNAQKLTADLIVTNADVRTMDRTNPKAEAFAVLGNKIVALGSTAEIKRLAGPETKTLDAGGRLVLPGFNDAHVHFTAMGNQFFSIDLRDAKTPAEAVEKIGFYARFLPRGHWLLGGGWNHENWTPSGLPAKELIDAATPDHPVFLYHVSAKLALVNSLALKLARIDKNTPGSEILRDAEGRPTGILKDAAMTLVKRFAPSPAADNKAAAIETAGNYAAAFGVTSVQDMSADDHTEVYRALARDGKLKTRIYDCAALAGRPKESFVRPEKAAAETFVREGCLKGLADGETASTAALYEEILAADRAGRQVMIHAIGGRANEQALAVFERVVKTNGKKDRRFRVEHAHGFRLAERRRFAASGIIASIQPFLFADGAGRSLEPLRALLAANAPVALGSDSSMIPVNPLFGIAAAVDASDPKQRISVEEAVRLYTLGAAYAEFQENEKGSLTVGKLADFVILSDDIFALGPEKIRRTKILTTVLDGRVVYRAG